MWNWIKKFSITKVWSWLGGRHFVLSAWFAVTAFWLAKHALLTREYSGVIVALQGYATWRASTGDKKDVAMATATNTTVVNVEPATDPATGSVGTKG